MTGLAKYHTALLNGNSADAEAAWQDVEAGAARLDSYYIPILLGDGVVESRDALTRSQVRELLRRIRAVRAEQ